MKPSILAVFACVLSHLCLHGAERAFVESSRSQILYDANGVVVSSADFQFVYDKHGNPVRDVSSDFFGAEYLGYDLNYYATNAFAPGLPGGPYSIILDSVALSNGIPYETVHAITTNSWATNQSTSFTDQITTYPDGHFDEMITTIVDQTSPDSHRSE